MSSSEYQQSTKKNGRVPLPPRDNSEKRRDYLEWDEYFMAVTFLELQKSGSESKGDAAIILNQRQIITSIANSDVPTDKDSEDLHTGHAEHKALNRIQEGVILYTTSFPCEKCAQAIVEAGILEVIYYQNTVDSDAAKELLKQGGVSWRQFISKKTRIEIDFSQFCDK